MELQVNINYKAKTQQKPPICITVHENESAKLQAQIVALQVQESYQYVLLISAIEHTQLQEISFQTLTES